MAAKSAQRERDSIGDVVKRVEELVALATKNPEEEEARSAAVKAARLMQEHGLMCVSREDVERAKTVMGDAQEIIARAKKEKTTQMAIGAAIGLFLGKKGLF